MWEQFPRPKEDYPKVSCLHQTSRLPKGEEIALWLGIWSLTLPKSNSSHLKMMVSNTNLLFQDVIFRCNSLVSGKLFPLCRSWHSTVQKMIRKPMRFQWTGPRILVILVYTIERRWWNSGDPQLMFGETVFEMKDAYQGFLFQRAVWSPNWLKLMGTVYGGPSLHYHGFYGSQIKIFVSSTIWRVSTETIFTTQKNQEIIMISPD